MPPRNLNTLSVVKPATTPWDTSGMNSLCPLRLGKLSMARSRISRAVTTALSSWNSMCSKPGILALGEVVTSLVWKHLAVRSSPGHTHCTSTTIMSTTPVIRASSCCM